MKSLIMLWQHLAEELGEMCGACTAADLKTVQQRVKDQGLAFMAITLPQFGKDLELGLSQGCISPDLFSGFQRRGKSPKFLGGFMDLIFDRDSGLLVESPSIDAIFSVRQLTLLYGKMELDATPEREASAMKGFLDVEEQLKKSDHRRTFAEKRKFEQMAGFLWSGVLSRVDSALGKEQRGECFERGIQPALHPKHGPGATADRLRGNAKFDLTEWPRRLEEVFPFGEYCIPNWRFNYRYNHVDLLEPGAERPVRVTAVPKTLDKPRIIAIEPTALQYMQQALMQVLVESIRYDEMSMAGVFVGFDDQTVNRRLAQEGSLSGDLATLDLSEASDRVSNQLVRSMLSGHTLTSEAVDATRSRKADVKGHGVIRLAKFASMGSALTFPIEAMVFLTIVMIGIERGLQRPLTRRDLFDLMGRVRIYGDDIIVPTEYASTVIESLEIFGLKVNKRKSFWTGKFRESCGREYYNGEDVSVTRVRKVIVRKDGDVSFPSSRQYVSELESFVNLRNRFYSAGLWKTAYYLDSQIEPLLGGVYPCVPVMDGNPEEDSYSRARLLGRWCFLGYQSERTHRTLHMPLVRAWVVSAPIPESKISGEGALLKVLAKRSKEPFADRKHLEHAGRPAAAYIKRQWCQPF